MNNKNKKSILNIESYANYLEQWLLRQLKITNTKGIVFGLSGGIDSAVVAGIAKTIVPQNHLAVVMHINNSSLDFKCTNEITKKFKLIFQNLDLNLSLKTLIETLNLDLKKDINIIGNLKARLRMVSLYALAQKKNYLVCGTSNYDEWMTGYFTKYGDSACDIALLRNCLKSDIYELGNYYSVPKIIMERKPTASLFPNQTDEKDLKIKYDELDSYWLNNKLLNDAKVKCIKNLVNQSNHKRKLPLAPKNRFQF